MESVDELKAALDRMGEQVADYRDGVVPALKSAAEGWTARAMAAEVELAEKWEEVKALAEQVAETKRRADASIAELRAENTSLYMQLKEEQEQVSASDDLRRAAAILREQATAARNMTGAGDWFAAPVSPVFSEWNVRSSGGRVAGDTSAEEATYIATMHPGVGLALADALEETAATWQGAGCPEGSEFVHLAHLIIGTRL